MRTAFDLVAWSAHRQPQGLAVLDPASGERVTYAELVARIEGTASDLAERGVAPGDLIATAMPNTVAHAVVLLALNRLGAIPAVISPRLKPGEVSELIGQGGMRGVVDATGVSLLRPSNPLAGTESAFVFYTSGTTGLPKGVVIPHRAIEPRILFMSTQCGLRFGAHNRLLGLMPLHHVIGFFGVFLTSLAFNGTWIPVSRFDPPDAIEIIDSIGVTGLFASPTHFDALLAAPNFAPERLRSLEHVMYAGAPMSDSLLTRLSESVRVPIVNIYGTTETMNSLYSPDAVRDHGRLQPGYHSRVRIFDGEVVVDARAEATFSHYLNNPDATAAKLADGWYRTGDAGYLDEGGFVVLAGRIDDMINSGAENVHPEEVEAVIGRHPAVADVAVVGLPDTRWGEVVAAAVVPLDTVTADDLDDFCRRSELADYKRPRRYFLVDELPRNTAMKVSRRKLRERLEEMYK